MFFVEEDQFFLYKHNGKWKAHGKYCFVKPVNKKKTFLDKHTKYEPLIGIVKYINEQLLQLGVKEGDEVKVKVIGFDRGKVKLSMKQASE